MPDLHVSLARRARRRGVWEAPFTRFSAPPESAAVPAGPKRHAGPGLYFPVVCGTYYAHHHISRIISAALVFKRNALAQDISMLVSIIITNFNYAAYIGRCIDSCLGQSYKNIEVIVVDDGSSDGSQDIILGYGARIKPIFKENGGQASAFNAGFAASRGGHRPFPGRG